MKEQQPVTLPAQLEEAGSLPAGELAQLLRRPRPTEPEEIRVGSLVQVTNVVPYKPVNPWLTTKHVFRVQLIDRLSEATLLVLSEVADGAAIAAALEDCALVGGAP